MSVIKPHSKRDTRRFQATDLMGRPVRGQDDLLVAVVEGIEGVEELFLQAFFAAEKCTSSINSTSTVMEAVAESG